MADITVKISDLPSDIKKQIPYSIRTFKESYILDELPPNIQTLLNDYFTHERTVEYKGNLFDFKPEQSEYGDLAPITLVEDLVIEYFNNFLNIGKFEYPFDPTFFSSIKSYVQTLDTSLQQTLIQTEINNIIRILQADLDTDISIENLVMDKGSETGMDVQYFIIIQLNINGKQKKVTATYVL